MLFACVCSAWVCLFGAGRAGSPHWRQWRPGACEESNAEETKHGDGDEERRNEQTGQKVN